MLLLSNAFSLGMIDEPEARLDVKRISLEEVKDILQKHNYKSVVGHEATASLLSSLLTIPVAFNREAIKLKKGDKLIVFQLLERLPEGKVLSTEEIRKINYAFYYLQVKEEGRE